VRRRCKNKHSDIAGDNGLGRSRGGFGTKIHLATDGSGLPLNIILSPGQAHESQFAQRLLDGIGIQHQNGSMKRRGHAVLADKVHSEHILHQELKRKGIKNGLPRKTNKKWQQMVVHNLIEMPTAIATLLSGVLVPERIPPHCHTLRQNGEELSGDGETGVYPAVLQKVM
jgi:hypothetical protein